MMRMMTVITESYTTENNNTKRYFKISNTKSRPIKPKKDTMTANRQLHISLGFTVSFYHFRFSSDSHPTL